jgi:hypothetical protein
MLHQLVSLERCTARGGRDSIDHPRGAQGTPKAKRICWKSACLVLALEGVECLMK